MIGCLVTGHGEFGPGLSKALAMIAGTQEHFQVVAFQEGGSLETYEHDIRLAIDGLLQETDGVIVFTDLLGGTPFRTAMTIAADKPNVQVLTGSNLPMLIEISLLRLMENDVVSLAKRAVEVGVEGVQHVTLEDIQQANQDHDDDELEGI